MQVSSSYSVRNSLHQTTAPYHVSPHSTNVRSIVLFPLQYQKSALSTSSSPNLMGLCFRNSPTSTLQCDHTPQSLFPTLSRPGRQCAAVNETLPGHRSGPNVPRSSPVDVSDPCSFSNTSWASPNSDCT